MWRRAYDNMSQRRLLRCDVSWQFDVRSWTVRNLPEPELDLTVVAMPVFGTDLLLFLEVRVLIIRPETEEVACCRQRE